MNARFAPNRMPLPPPILADTHGRVPADRHGARVRSATDFVSRIVLAAIAIVMAAVLVASAPGPMMIPLATVFVTGVVATALVMLGDRRLSNRERWSRQPTGERDERRRKAPGRDAGWRALAAASAVALVLALLAPGALRAALVVTGLAGLAALRLAAMYGRWIPYGVPPADRPERSSAARAVALLRG
jgi:hypothetical protein